MWLWWGTDRAGRLPWWRAAFSWEALEIVLAESDDGTALTDFDPEEIERKISISTAIASSEWNKTKINFLDTPGKGVFIQDTRTSMRVSESVLILVDAVAGRRGSDRESL
jgi:elongation factor G